MGTCVLVTTEMKVVVKWYIINDKAFRKQSVLEAEGLSNLFILHACVGG